MLVSTLVTYSSTMSNSSSTTYLSATIPTTSTTSPTSLLLTLSSAQPPATSSNCTFYSLKMLFDDHLGVHLGDLVGHHGQWAPPTPPVGYPRPSGLCLEFINAKTIEKKLSRYLYFNVLHVLPVAQWPIFDQKRWRISGCLEGVCGCLVDVWMVPE